MIRGHFPVHQRPPVSLPWPHPCVVKTYYSTMGVTIEKITSGDGVNFPKKGDKVTIHYVGTLKADGKKFDSSRDRNEPFETKIGVGKVIRGWDEGVPQLSLGEKARLIITSDYGYGGGGYPPVIPAHADLIFEVELLKIN
ncbi:hypothetical protein D9756_004353 [Leucocoprinus leucothites]|uniref:peptidylprolyl isomerase n=1 Tax=Leucocoprinus leucothites TaxID=201217 RepID=A0A8H5D960_9AGAR|nr:hypothetical protein D9756_004353 [Leucoagaricus leucothites]